MTRLQKPYFYSLIAITSTFLLVGCSLDQRTKDECQEFTQVMQTVVDETQKVKQNAKFDRESLLRFVIVNKASADKITNQLLLKDTLLSELKINFSTLYEKYASASSKLLQLDDIKTNPKIGYESLNAIKQAIAEEKNLLTSLNNYCQPHGFIVNNVVP